MSNTSLTTKVSAVARLDARPRHRRGGAGRDPADRLPRPVPLERQRLDGADAGARRQEPDPEGDVGHRHRREAALPGGDAREGRPQGRRDLRPGVPQRARRRRGHLPRPADHDRRPERGPHATRSRRSSPGSSGRSRSRSPAPRASSGTSRAATASTSTTARARRAARSSAFWRRTSLVMRAPAAEGAACDPPRRRAAWRRSSRSPLTPVRSGSSCAPQATRRTPRRRPSRAPSSWQQIKGQK